MFKKKKHQRPKSKLHDQRRNNTTDEEKREKTGCKREDGVYYYALKGKPGLLVKPPVGRICRFRKWEGHRWRNPAGTGREKAPPGEAIQGTRRSSVKKKKKKRGLSSRRTRASRQRHHVTTYAADSKKKSGDQSLKRQEEILVGYGGESRGERMRDPKCNLGDFAGAKGRGQRRRTKRDRRGGSGKAEKELQVDPQRGGTEKKKIRLPIGA